MPEVFLFVNPRVSIAFWSVSHKNKRAGRVASVRPVCLAVLLARLELILLETSIVGEPPDWQT
jgi:hypothetical protein